ncbi:teichuronic acid biosynthesis glycosyltransferase TuaH [Arthrobacter sp. GAS37]
MRIAYISHVDSQWIKQRPHFMAESLRHDDDRVTYVCSLFVRRRLLVSSQRLRVPVLRVPLLPQRLRRLLRIFDAVASAISACLILFIVRPHIAVVTHSRHRYLASFLHRAGVRVFYDCMDLNGLFNDATVFDREDERKLVEIVDVVFCSSLAISEHIKGLQNLVVTKIVPNALHPASFERFFGRELSVQPGLVGYVGAISSWFDFDSVLALLDSNPNITVRLWGPCDVEVPQHERLHKMGVVPHEQAIEVMHNCAVLLLPFVLNDLILAVDPVKVYEYVSTGRPVIVRDYPQLLHFGSHVRRYETAAELVSRVEDALEEKGQNQTLISDFIRENSWEERALLMKRVMS